MEVQQLKEYYKKVCELEKSVAMQKAVIADSITAYNNAKPNPVPPVKIPEYPKEPVGAGVFEFPTKMKYYGIVIFFGIGALIGIWSLICGIQSDDGIFKFFGAILLIGGGAVVFLFMNNAKPYEEARAEAEEQFNKENRAAQLARENYEKAVQEYSGVVERVERDNMKIEENNKKNLSVWKSNSRVLKTLQDKLKDTERKLEEVYSEGIIYPKYRNLVAAMTICEYLETGRCAGLEGADGAYNLYESEIRQNRVIDELTEVNRNLNTIQRNQYYLYQSMQEIKKETTKMNVALRGIWNSTNDILQVATIQTYLQAIDTFLV